MGTLRLLDAIRTCGLDKKVKFYQASTSELYGKVQEIPQKETTPFYPRSPYGEFLKLPFKVSQMDETIYFYYLSGDKYVVLNAMNIQGGGLYANSLIDQGYTQPS